LSKPDPRREPPIWRDDDAPPFAEPWQAKAFALTLQLHEAGHFTWREWADTLGEVLEEAGINEPSDDGTGYYRHWLTALERLTDVKQLSTSGERATRKQAWKTAYQTTPHGEPVTLKQGTLTAPNAAPY
jgi:nitrile hydratase accessory protein